MAVVCESTACLPPELADRYGIGIIPVPFIFGDETFLDGVDITTSEFYERLTSSHTPPKTSPPSPGEYLAAWEKAAKLASDVVSVTVSGKISTMQRSTKLAQEMAAQKLPGVRVEVVDSLSAAMGQGFVALEAARAAERGEPLERVVEAARRASESTKMIVTLDTLEYLAKTAHIPQLAAFFGGLLKIKPIFQISGGDVQVLTKIRTRRRSIEQLLWYVQQNIPPDSRPHVAVHHAQAPEEAAELEEWVRSSYDCSELYTTEFTPVMGGYCGPRLLGIAFYLEEPGRAG